MKKHCDIILKNITKSYNNEIVLNNLSFTFKCGEINIITGKSGCGKTTLMNILLGLEKPDSGSVQGINDKQIGVVFQENRLCEYLTAVQNIKLVTNDKYTKKEIISFLNELQLDSESCEKPVSKLSGGMKRRVSILRAVLFDSDVLLLDEPFKGLDDDTKQKVMDFVLQKTKGKTVIIITHLETQMSENKLDFDILK